MAASVGNSPAAVLARTKSVNWAFGQLRLAFPERERTELREVLDELSRKERARSVEDIVGTAVLPAARKSPSFLESSYSPAWTARAEQLCELVTAPLATDALLALARDRLGWSRNPTLQVVAAAEELELLHYDRASFAWGRGAPEDHGAAAGRCGNRTGCEGVRGLSAIAPDASSNLAGATRSESEPCTTPKETIAMTTTSATSPLEKSAAQQSAPSANGAGASVPSASGGTGPGDVNKRRSESVKRTLAAKKQTTPPPNGAELAFERMLDTILADPAGRRAFGRIVGRRLGEALGA